VDTNRRPLQQGEKTIVEPRDARIGRGGNRKRKKVSKKVEWGGGPEVVRRKKGMAKNESCLDKRKNANAEIILVKIYSSIGPHGKRKLTDHGKGGRAGKISVGRSGKI